MKAICHIHTKFSSDSTISPSKLVDYADRMGIRILLICDHDSFEGSMQARRYAIDKRIIKKIFIPVAAEIQTEFGDIIVALNHAYKSLNILEFKIFDNLISNTKAEGGVIILPHPFVNHKHVEHIAKHVDCIEVFNSRCSNKQNQDALHLCLRFNKVPIYGADAHFYTELDNAITWYREFNEKDTFLSPPVLLIGKQTQNYKICFSGLVKSIKTYQFRNIIASCITTITWIVREKVFLNKRRKESIP